VTGRWEPTRKGGEVERGGREVGFLRWRETGEKGKNYAILPKVITHMENKVDWHCRNQEREFLLLPSCPDLVSLLLVGQIFPSRPIPSEADSNKKCIKLEIIIMEINTPL